jgi:hypothetical protein
MKKMRLECLKLIECMKKMRINNYDPIGMFKIDRMHEKDAFQQLCMEKMRFNNYQQLKLIAIETQI